MKRNRKSKARKRREIRMASAKRVSRDQELRATRTKNAIKLLICLPLLTVGAIVLWGIGFSASKPKFLSLHTLGFLMFGAGLMGLVTVMFPNRIYAGRESGQRGFWNHKRRDREFPD